MKAAQFYHSNVNILSLGTPRCLVINKFSCMEADCDRIASIAAFIVGTTFQDEVKLRQVVCLDKCVRC